MADQDFTLPIPSGAPRRLTAGWLMLALYSLIGAGLVVILVVIARMPLLHSWMPWTGSFKTALVIHVDLSVLVWFLSFAGVMASLNLDDRAGGGVGFTALGVSTTGAVLITFSPFLGVDAPYMNNYVPVLENGAFFLGLLLFLAGTGLMAGYGLLAARPADGWSQGSGALQLGLRTGLLILLLALGIWGWSFATMPRVDGVIFYEALFWGGGHVLQFTHTQFVVVAWLWLASVAGGPNSLTPRVATLLFFLGALPVLAAPVLHLRFVPGDPGFQSGFADLMKYGGGVAALPAGLAVLLALRTPQRDPAAAHLRMALWLSLVLFGVGGVIGFLIQGINVTIPSHYHGSIVSVTVAYMGLTYHLLPRLGFAPPDGRWATRQLLLYGGGSLLHVFGLAWSGMLGIQRKTAGDAQGLETLTKKMAMGVTGAGGLIAVIGGILFLVLCYRAIRKNRASATAA